MSLRVTGSAEPVVRLRAEQSLLDVPEEPLEDIGHVVHLVFSLFKPHGTRVVPEGIQQ